MELLDLTVVLALRSGACRQQALSAAEFGHLAKHDLITGILATYKDSFSAAGKNWHQGHDPLVIWPRGVEVVNTMPNLSVMTDTTVLPEHCLPSTVASVSPWPAPSRLKTAGSWPLSSGPSLPLQVGCPA